jgi:hypothetical protein
MHWFGHSCAETNIKIMACSKAQHQPPGGSASPPAPGADAGRCDTSRASAEQARQRSLCTYSSSCELQIWRPAGAPIPQAQTPLRCEWQVQRPELSCCSAWSSNLLCNLHRRHTINRTVHAAAWHQQKGRGPPLASWLASLDDLSTRVIHALAHPARDAGYIHERHCAVASTVKAPSRGRSFLSLQLIIHHHELLLAHHSSEHFITGCI